MTFLIYFLVPFDFLVGECCDSGNSFACNAADSAEHEIIPMGEKGRTQLMRTQMKDSVPFVFLETTKLSPSWSLVCYLADQISSTGFDKVTCFCSHSTLTFNKGLR